MKYVCTLFAGLSLSLVNFHVCRAGEITPSTGPGTLRTVSLDDMEQVKTPVDPQLSPDGEQVAFVYDDRIHLVSVRDGEARAVTTSASKALQPRWSAAGRYLYFLSDQSGSNQLWKLPAGRSGEAVRLTDLDDGVEILSLSPDETRLLLSVRDKPPATDRIEGKTAPWVITRLDFKEDDGDGYITGDDPDHLYVHDIEAGSMQQVTAGTYKEMDPAWSPDSRSIVFAANREADPDVDYRSDLWIADINNPDLGKNLRRLTRDARTRKSPAFSPDGRHIAFIDAEDGVYGIQRLAIMPVAGGVPKILTDELDRWVTGFRFSADGEWIYLLYENGGGRHLARVRISDKRLERLVEGERFCAEMDPGVRERIALTLAQDNQGPDVHILESGTLRRLTRLHEEFFLTRTVGAREKISFSSRDGARVEAFVTKPPGYVEGQRYPTILNIHGGPVLQFTWGYDFFSQYLAAQGYVVVEPNPRGSTGRGQAYIRQIYRSWGITDYPDVIAAVDSAIELGISDPDRLAVLGFSYGGFMVNMIITRTARFKAAAAGAGQSLIVANYGHDIYQKWYHWEFGLPWENRELYERISPFNYVGHVQTPTLFLGGRQDWSVTILNSEIMYQALRKRGIETRLVVYPDTHHGNWDISFRKDYLQRVVRWFDRFTAKQGEDKSGAGH